MSDLQMLWQSDAPPIDIDRLIAQMQRQNRALRRVNMISFAVCALSLVLILVLEFAGRISTGGLLSFAGAIGFGWSFWKYRRDKARLITAYSEVPNRLLPFLIEQTRKARNLGRYFYMTPLPSVFLGYGIGYLTDDDAGADAVNTDLLIAVLIPAISFMVGITIFGVRLARTKTKELEELEATWAEFQRALEAEDETG